MEMTGDEWARCWGRRRCQERRISPNRWARPTRSVSEAGGNREGTMSGPESGGCGVEPRGRGMKDILAVRDILTGGLSLPKGNMG